MNSICVHIYIYIYIHDIYIYVYIYIYIHTSVSRRDTQEAKLGTPSPPTKSLDFRGFDSSRLLIPRGGNSHVRRICIAGLLESLTQGLLVGKPLIGGLGVVRSIAARSRVWEYINCRCIYIYIYIERERDIEIEIEREREIFIP